MPQRRFLGRKYLLKSIPSTKTTEQKYHIHPCTKGKQLLQGMKQIVKIPSKPTHIANLNAYKRNHL